MSGSDLVYGVAYNGTFHSGRMSCRCSVANGLYSVDMEADDFMSTISPADVAAASRYFRKSSRMDVFRGISFKDGFVPANPVAFESVPIVVVEPTYDDFEEVEVVRFRSGKSGKDQYYFLQTVETSNAYVLMDMKSDVESASFKKPSDYKGATPEMKVAYTLQLAEIAAEKQRLLDEKRRKEEKEPINAIKIMMEEVGATVEKVVKTNRGFEASWRLEKYKFLTIFDRHLKVVNAGYCVRNQDGILSPRSIVNVLKDGIKQHGDDGMIHATLAYDGRDFDDDDDFDDGDDD